MLFGSGSSKFNYSGSEVILHHSNMRPEWCNRDYTMRISRFPHYYTFDFKGDYSSFWIDVNLHNYQNTSASISAFNTIYQYLYKNVYFSPHSTGSYISGSNGVPVVFFVREMQHKNLFDNYFEKGDILSIHFQSNDYTNLTGSLF